MTIGVAAVLVNSNDCADANWEMLRETLLSETLIKPMLTALLINWLLINFTGNGDLNIDHSTYGVDQSLAAQS